MRKSLSIAFLNLFQGIRTQSFWVTGLLGGLLVGAAFLLRVLAVGERAVMLRAICLASMEISSLLLVVFSFANTYHREHESRLDAVYLTYVSSREYLQGKLWGIWMLLFLHLSGTALLGSALLLADQAFSGIFLVGGYSIFLKLAILCSFSLLFSCLFESPVLASLITIFVYLAAEIAGFTLSLMSEAQNPILRWLYRIMYHLLPNADKIDLKYQGIRGLPVPVEYLGEITLYALAYSLAVFCLAWWVFSRKEA